MRILRINDKGKVVDSLGLDIICPLRQGCCSAHCVCFDLAAEIWKDDELEESHYTCTYFKDQRK